MWNVTVKKPLNYLDFFFFLFTPFLDAACFAVKHYVKFSPFVNVCVALILGEKAFDFLEPS